MIGGVDLKTRITTGETHRFSVSQKKWSKGPKLNSPRCHAIAAYLGGFIFTYSGFDDTGVSLNSIERIETRTFEKW